MNNLSKYESLVDSVSKNQLHIDLMNIIPSGLFMVDTNNIVTFANKRAAEILGYEANELIGKSCFKFACTPCEANCGLNDIRIPKPIFNKICTVKTQTGEIKTIRKNANEIFDKNGIKIGGFESFEDITDQIKTEEKLQILSKAIEASSSSIVITDKNGNIQYVNPYFEKITGYSREEAVGKNPRILKSGEQGFEYYKKLWETISSGKQWKGEFHNKKKNGESYWELATISPILDEKNSITHYVAVKDDITQRKMSELFKTRLISIIGHDLRGIFLNITGFAQMIKNFITPETNKNLEISITQILKSGEFGSELLENLVSWAKIQSNLVQVNLQKQNLKFSIQTTVNQLENCANQKNIKLENLIPQNIEFVFDEIMLNTIIRNITSNSIKFTPNGGIIKIECEKSENQIEIRISDNGVGMNQETVDKLFTTQKSTTTLGTNKEKGTGLGLKICADLVKLMNGKITLKSVENMGTTFSILLKEEIN